MRLPKQSSSSAPCDQHLAYCTNIHPGESWHQIRLNLEKYALAVRNALRSNGSLKQGEPYAIGLRLGQQAAIELLEGDELSKFKDWLENEGAYVFTINGFPYGQFHGTRVKEQVYRPDWTESARLSYTKDLFKILDELLRVAPAGTAGSVSTLPGSFKGFGVDERRLSSILANLYACREYIEELSASSGHEMHLGLEPEPFGLFETSGETLKFFGWLAESYPQDKDLLKLIGLNYDCCHLAVEFEQAEVALERIVGAGIRLSKIHLSNALCFIANEKSIAAVNEFADDTYLHQVICQSSEELPLRRFVDLPNALEYWRSYKNKSALAGEEWRVLFHVPIHQRLEPPIGDTSDHLRSTIDYILARPSLCQHFEIETYTWGVLPSELKSADVVTQITGEYQWVLDAFNRS